MNITSISAGYHLRYWLENEKLGTNLRYGLANWLLVFPNHPTAYKLMELWINNDPEKDVVQEIFYKWLNYNALSFESGMPIQAWNKKYGCEEIREEAIKWLEQHGRQENASDFLKTWLNNNCDPSLIAPYFDSWLSLHPESPLKSDLTQAWQKNTPTNK